MARTATGARLIIICGLPGSGKTTLAKKLQTKLGAVRFSPDEWMSALSLDLYDEDRRAKIEVCSGSWHRNCSPQHHDFEGRTMWSLSNAFTSAFKELDPIPQFRATARLGRFLETASAAT